MGSATGSILVVVCLIMKDLKITLYCGCVGMLCEGTRAYELQAHTTNRTGGEVLALCDKKLVNVMKCACERGLALCEENETLGSATNGNYVMLHLLAVYDGFLKQHIHKQANPMETAIRTICPQ